MVKEIRTKLEKVIKEQFNSDTMIAEVGSCRFSNRSATFKIEFVDDSASSLAESNWNLLCSSFGLKKAWLGKTITINGKSFDIVGLKPRARKNSVIIANSEGREYVTTPRTVQSCLA